MADPYFVKLTLGNGAEALINMGNVTFIYQQAGALTTIRFTGSTDNSIMVKENLRDLAGKLPPLA
jgi:hypothetical protein